MIFQRLDRVMVANNEMNQSNAFWQQLIGVRGTIIGISGDGLVDFAGDDDDLSKPCTIVPCEGVSPERFTLLPPTTITVPIPRPVRFYRRVSHLIRRII